MFDEPEEVQSPSYWPSVSDLFMTLFIVAIAMLVNFDLMQAVTDKSQDLLREENLRLTGDFEKIRAPVNLLRQSIGQEDLNPKLSSDAVVGALEAVSGEVTHQLLALKTGNKQLDQLLRENADLTTRLRSLVNENESHLKDLEDLKKTHAALLSELAGLRFQIADLEKKNAEFNTNADGVTIVGLRKKIEELNLDLKRLNDQPPIILVQPKSADEAKVFTFGSGESVGSSKAFDDFLQLKFEELRDYIVKYGDRDVVDTLEIIGHTDGKLHKLKDGNFAAKLPSYLAGESGAGLKADTNSELGLLRALSMKEKWEAFVKREASNNSIQAKLLERIKIRCYSAAQTAPPANLPIGTILNKEFYQSENPLCRRIELRLTKLNRNDERQVVPSPPTPPVNRDDNKPLVTPPPHRKIREPATTAVQPA